MASLTRRKPLLIVASLCLIAAVVAGTHRALADDESRSDRVSRRMAKDADERLKTAMEESKKREMLKAELTRSKAINEMAAELADDSQFKARYKEFANHTGRLSDIRPDDGDVQKEMQRIMQDPEEKKQVMARAILLLQRESGDGGDGRQRSKK